MAQTGYTPLQIYSSSTGGNVPSAGNLTNNTIGSELAINITDGKLFYKDNANAVQVIAWKTTPTTAGGTGLTSYTAGDLLYYVTGTTLSKLAIGSNGQILKSTGSAPAWENVSALAVTSISFGTTGLTPSTATQGAVTVAGTLVAANGGTGQSSYTVGDILYASGSTTLSKLADVATGNALISGGVGVAPSWGKIGLTTHVSGTLPTANGGTNLTSFTANGVMYASSTSALATHSGFTYNGANQVGINSAIIDLAKLSIDTGAQYGIDLYRSDVAANYAAIRFRNTTNSGTYASIGFDSGGLRLNGDGGSIYFTTGSTQHGAMDSSGNLGIDGAFNSAGAWMRDAAKYEHGYNAYRGSLYGTDEQILTARSGYQTKVANRLAVLGTVVPYSDNTYSCGESSLRWSVVYAATGTINTSDERHKDQISNHLVPELRAWAKVEYCKYKYKDAVQQKGDGARWHIGLIAQRVKEAFESEGLNAFEYGLLCYDAWDDNYTIHTDENGNETGKTLNFVAGDRYGIRYEEALAMECAYLRSQLNK